jgi:hypothetical protein
MELQVGERSETNPVAYRRPLHEHDTSPLSVGAWVLMLLLFTIPVLNLILYLYWAFGPPLKVNVNRRNYSRAVLIVMAVALILRLLAAL